MPMRRNRTALLFLWWLVAGAALALGGCDADGDGDIEGDADPSGDPVAGQKPEVVMDRGATAEPDKPGPYRYKSFTRTFGENNASSGIVYYPVNGQEGETFPAVVFGPGAMGFKEVYTWVGTHMASHGYLCMTTTPASLTGYSAGNWSHAILAGIEKLKQENADPASPIFALMDESAIGAFGHSMGGAGAVQAAFTNPEIKAVSGLAPALYKRYFPADLKVSVPTQIIIGDTDEVVEVQSNIDFYDSKALAGAAHRELVIVKNASHMAWIDPVIAGLFADVKKQYAVSRRFYVSWFQYYLKGYTDFYGTYIYGEQAEQDLGDGLLTRLEFTEP